MFKKNLFYRPPAAATAGLRFPAPNFVKNEVQAKKDVFSVSFTKFLRTSFDRTCRVTAPCVYLGILRSFSEHLFYRAPYFKYKLQNFNHQIQ